MGVSPWNSQSHPVSPEGTAGTIRPQVLSPLQGFAHVLIFFTTGWHPWLQHAVPSGLTSLRPIDTLKSKRGIETGPDVHKAENRCSNKGFLAMTSQQYLELLDWTGRLTVSGKSGATPKHVPGLLTRLGMDVDQWKQLVDGFGSLFSIVAASPSKSISTDRRRRQKIRLVIATELAGRLGILE